MSFWDRVTGKVVADAGLGQKKRAVATGIEAFDGPIRDLQLEIAIKSHPWLQNSATSAFLLSIWAAQALQDMAAVLQASAQSQLGEAGKLPEATFVLADSLYDAALHWIEYAQTALAAIDENPGFELTLILPANAPRLDWVADALPAHFVATIQAAVQLGTAVENAFNNMQDDRSRLPPKYDGAFKTIMGATRLARAKLDQVEAAGSDRQAVRLSHDIWAMLQEVVRLYFRAGQQIARPGLIDPQYDAFAQATARARRLPPRPAPLPPPTQAVAPRPTGTGRSPAQAGQGRVPGPMPRPASPPAPLPPVVPTLSQRLGLAFDAWSLTDRGAKSVYGNDPTRIAELEAFWRADTNPNETYRLFSLIIAAVQARQVTVRPGEFSKACPWISTFVALRDTTIGTERFPAGQMFSLKAGAEGNYFGRGFERLGFVRGAQKPKPEPAQASGPPRIDTQHGGDRKPRASQRAATPAIPSGDDMWCLTAAFQRPQRRANPADAEKLRQLWRADPDPGSTIQFHGELIEAVRAGSIRQHGDEALRDCPWSQVYVAASRVTIGGVQLEQNEKFAFQVGLLGDNFRRSISRLGSIKPA